MKIIIKVQRPFAGDMSRVLVYNQDKSIFAHLPYGEDVKRLIGDKLKIYCECDFENGVLGINKVIEDQPW